ncbi:hypothetical protein [Streptomyces sp. NPDC014656]|uniref:hypothetical protein n=1 Tax=Streptomyces sp. NPDC014656 TaxID=3364878 RepID=UPI0036FBE556
MREVRHLAATDRFEGREEELAAMAAFVTAAEDGGGGGGGEAAEDGEGGGRHGGYWRWLGPAWAGKTALMAQFVLHPPEGVDVLAFFVTARMAGRADRTAFLSTLEGQLRAYLQDGDVDCSAPGGFLDGLERAAARARATGRRLVLVVDGMDEDAGLPSAVGGDSIAACLPHTPPAGMRVILAGRPHPPVPADVLTGPLLTDAIDHELAVSPAAQAVRADAERNLEALIASGGLSLELVGLTAAAGGGLSPADFARLGTAPRRRIELVLGGSTGRAFQHRPAQWTTDAEGRPEVLYSFAHQDLLHGARGLLDHGELNGYRARIHAWADRARRDAWPAATSEYLLSGYPQLLHELRDTARLTALATDRARHECLWQTTGTDSQTFTEIADAFRLHLATTPTSTSTPTPTPTPASTSTSAPDLTACVRLAHHRESLQHTADVLPATVITTWARLGLLRRAVTAATQRSHLAGTRGETLLGSILTAAGTTAEATAHVIEAAQAFPAPETRSRALAEITQALAARSRWEHATRLAASLADRGRRAEAMTSIAVAMGAAGEHGAAVRLAREIAVPELRAHAVTSVARAMAEAGAYEDAVGLARGIPDPGQRARALTGVAWAMAEAGDHTGAAALAHTVTGTEQRGEAFTGIAVAMAEGGEYGQAIELAGTLGHPGQRAQALTGITVAMAEAGDHAGAAALARTITDTEQQARTLTEVARVTAENGDHDAAVELARTITDPAQQAQALMGICRAMAAARDPDGGVALARTIADPEARAWAFTGVSRATAESGDHEAAVGLAHAIADADARASAFEGIVLAAARLGAHRAAIELACDTTDLVTDLDVLGITAEAMAEAGNAAAAHQLAERAARLAHSSAAAHRMRLLAAAIGASAAVGPEFAAATAGLVGSVPGLARGIAHHEERAWTLADVARALAEAGAYDAAVELAEAVPHADPRAWALADIAVALAAAGRHEAAIGRARTVGVPSWQGRTIGSIATLMARAGERDAAVELARTLAHPGRRQEAQAGIAVSLAEAGDLHGAVEAARSLTLPVLQARTLSDITGFAAAAGEREAAVELARTIPHAELRAEALAGIAVAVAESGDHGAALELARTLTDEDSRTEAFAGIAVAAARCGDRDGAVDAALALVPKPAEGDRAEVAVALAEGGSPARGLDLARALPHPGHRARALAGIARATGSRRLFAEALSLSFGPRVVTELARLDGDALQSLVRDLLEELSAASQRAGPRSSESGQPPSTSTSAP